MAVAIALGSTAPAVAQAPWTAPADAKATKNPVAGLGKAKASATANCATCHGATGTGNGAAAAALTPKPADWTAAAIQSQSDGELFWKITNGRGAMPPWRHLPDRERWELVNYIRTLKKK
jgi:mono/diheme cytochrome c family protein